MQFLHFALHSAIPECHHTADPNRAIWCIACWVKVDNRTGSENHQVPYSSVYICVLWILSNAQLPFKKIHTWFELINWNNVLTNILFNEICEHLTKGWHGNILKVGYPLYTSSIEVGNLMSTRKLEIWPLRGRRWWRNVLRNANARIEDCWHVTHFPYHITIVILNLIVEIGFLLTDFVLSLWRNCTPNRNLVCIVWYLNDIKYYATWFFSYWSKLLKKKMLWSITQEILMY